MPYDIGLVKIAPVSLASPNVGILKMAGPDFDASQKTGYVVGFGAVSETGESGLLPWWRHQMETFSALLTICAGNSPVTGEFPAQWPVTRTFDVFFDVRLKKRLSKN